MEGLYGNNICLADPVPHERTVLAPHLTGQRSVVLRSEMEDGMGMLEALPAVVRGGLVKAAKQCGAGVLADVAGAASYPSQRCLFGNKRADSGAAGTWAD